MPKGIYPGNKGQIPWNKGKKFPLWYRKKISIAHMGIKYSEESKIKRSIIFSGKGNPFYGKKHSEKTKFLMGKKKKEYFKTHVSRLKGVYLSEEHKTKLSIAGKGKHKSPKTEFKKGMSIYKHPRWLGGKSFEPYGIEFNYSLKESIRNRDRRKCQLCGCPEIECRKKLDIHHIDYNKKNNSLENLISLCYKCHMKTNGKREFWKNYLMAGQRALGG